MAIPQPAFTMGIEEEYLLVDRDSLALCQAPPALMDDCAAALQDQVSPEFLQCQVEVGTRVCPDIQAARDDLRRLRSTVALVAARHNLAPIAASCHPFSDWKDQQPTDRNRYSDLERALGGVAHRMLICGMHVHIGIDDKDQRIELMNQMRYFLPHLLALSASSPYWQGRDTKLASYRLTVFDNLPRTGLPPIYDSWSAYERATGALVDIGVIEDTTKIWWDQRPSDRFPTLETRICDVAPRLEDTLTLAALVQALTRMLWRLRASNQQWRLYDRLLIDENRWRALRFGTTEGLIDLGRGTIRPMSDLVADLLDLTAEDADALGSTAELARLPDMARETAAERQRATFAQATAKGADRDAALRAVTQHLVEAFHQDL